MQHLFQMKSEAIFDITEKLQEWIEQNLSQPEGEPTKYTTTEEDIPKLRAMVEEARTVSGDLIYTKEEADDIYALLAKLLEILKRDNYLELEFE